MDTSKIIRGIVNGRNYTVTSPIVKEDYGLYLKIEGLELPQTYEVDFSNSENSGTSVTMIGNADGVLIPHQFISTGKDVFAFLYYVGDNYGRTVFKFRIPNKLRPDRTDETPTPEEQSTIDQAIAALNTAVAKTAQDVIDADASAQSASADADRAEEARTDAQNYATQAEQSATDAQISAQASANSATASAQSTSQSAQIKADVEELVDDAQGYATASEQSAQASANSASQASGYATSASQSATSAQGYASQAQSSAQTASSKASEASQSATTATQKATESAQSATTASNKATEASGYATASQTAQGLAESARDSAITAKTDAESARDDAITAKEEAESAVASISGALDDKADIITDTASGSIASFTDGADDLPLKSLVVDINPIQDLSHGDPSPENLCPISGWTEVDVEQSGVNLFDGNSFVSGRYDNADFSISSASETRSAKIYLKAGSYTLSANGTSSINRRILNGAMSSATRNLPMSFTLSADGWFGFSTTDLTSDFKLELGSTATPYSPYTGRSITIDLGQTVYGGKLDVLSGELVIDRAMVDLGTLSWNYVASSACNFRASELIGAKAPATAVVTPNAICSILTVLDYTTVSTPVDGITIIFATSAQAGKVWAHSGTYTDATAFKAAMTGQTLVYELATPLTVQLTPNQVNSLLGVNNIWADSGDTEVEYRANTKLWVQKKIAEAIASLS